MTNIEWTGKTWNPVVGCSKVSAGCNNCYAIPQSHRNAAIAQELPIDRRGRLKYYEGLTEKRGDRIEWTGVVNFVEEALEIPLKRKKSTVWFVNSMSDLFHESVTDEQLDRIFVIMALTPQHTYQILTKRPKRMLDYFLSNRWDDATFGGIPLSDVARLAADLPVPLGIPLRCHFPLANVHLGVTVENQKAADDRIPLLLQTPASVRFLSIEPLLERVDLTLIKQIDDFQQIHKTLSGHSSIDGQMQHLTNSINWVIVGGESGHGARLFDLAWARDLREQCEWSNVPFFFKQCGANCIDSLNGNSIDTKGKGADWADPNFPADLKIRQLPLTASEI